MNINQNFLHVKADFTEPLSLINEYLKVTEQLKVIKEVGSKLIYKLIGKTNNLD